MGCGLERLCRQIEAEQKEAFVLRGKEDYLIRGEANQVFRWSLTVLIVIAHLIRIFYFDRGYFLLTHVSLGYFGYRLSQNKYNPSKKDIAVLKASDMVGTKDNPCEGLISFYFRHKLSPEDFDSLVFRILEFKFWYFTTKLVLLTFLLSWYTLFRCTFIGPGIFFFWLPAV